jgi:Mrp family chromosome partitioning ATPase
VKSYIERAIEMAKSRRKLAEGSAPPAGEAPASEGGHAAGQHQRRRAVAPPATNGHHAAAGHLPPISLAQAVAIVADSGTLRQNRILVGTDSQQPAEGAYRMLRTRVLRQMRTNGWRRLGITAARPGEGKSLTAINLAIAIAAERSQPVVLVDLDLRRPRIHRYLGIAESQFASVGDYLEGRSNSLDPLVVSLVEQGLYCVLGSRPIEHSSDLLASPQGQAFLNDLADRLPGAILIYDLPPLLSTDDPLVAAPTLDALLLVVAEGGTPREDIGAAAKLLSEFNLLGVVLNRSLERSEKGYYNY